MFLLLLLLLFGLPDLLHDVLDMLKGGRSARHKPNVLWLIIRVTLNQQTVSCRRRTILESEKYTLTAQPLLVASMLV